MGSWVSSVGFRQKFLDLVFMSQEDRKGFKYIHLTKIPNQILCDHKSQTLENKWMKIHLLLTMPLKASSCFWPFSVVDQDY